MLRVSASGCTADDPAGIGYVLFPSGLAGGKHQHVVVQGYKWKAKSNLPSIANTTDEFTSSRPGKGDDADPCSTWYPGHRAFEAPEVNNIANYIQTLPNVKAFIDLRSYGQMCTFTALFSFDVRLLLTARRT